MPSFVLSGCSSTCLVSEVREDETVTIRAEVLLFSVLIAFENIFDPTEKRLAIPFFEAMPSSETASRSQNIGKEFKGNTGGERCETKQRHFAARQVKSMKTSPKYARSQSMKKLPRQRWMIRRQRIYALGRTGFTNVDRDSKRQGTGRRL
jgi:hypothetical protein